MQGGGSAPPWTPMGPPGAAQSKNNVTHLHSFILIEFMTAIPKRSGIPLKWNLEAVNRFYEALLEHGKDFEKISIFLLKKSINRNPQKIPNHFTWVGVRCFYYRILKKASNLLHAYVCRNPDAPIQAGVELKKSNNLIVSSSVSPKRCEQSELSKNDPVSSFIITLVQ